MSVHSKNCTSTKNTDTSSSLAELAKALLWEILVYKSEQGNCRRIATELDSQKGVEKFAYNKAKIMQNCINVRSSRNDKVRHLA